MKIFERIAILVVSFLVAFNVTAQDRAVFRNSQGQHRVEVIIKAQSDDSKQIIAALYTVDKNGKRRQINKFQQSVSTVGDLAKFSLALSSAPASDTSYMVSVFEFPTSEGTFSYELPVGRELTTVLAASTEAACPNALEIMFTGPDYMLKDWEDVARWLSVAEDKTKVMIKSGAINSNFPVKDISVLTNPRYATSEGQMLVCVKLEPNLPLETYSASIEFTGPPKLDLARPITGNGFKSAPIPKTPTSADDNGVPGQRGMERNLDLGISFTSSVGEKTADDGTTFLGRTNRGTFDIRVAPLLKTQGNKSFDRDQKWYRYFTPFYLDAAVSTGKIDKETLSMNRVIFGTEYEWRYYDFSKLEGTEDTKTDPYVTFHRIILKGNHASDRDFKQLEYTGTVEYQPVVGALNHPLFLNWKYDGAGNRVPGKFGYEIVPKFGFTLGRTYARRDPAAVIKPSNTVRRLHIGLDMTFNLTRYVQLSVKDILYIRGEAPDDRIHNYFKAGIEAPLGRPFGNTVNSLFLTFERGNQPPFATRDVNVFKIGYRIRSEGWFDRFR